MSDIVAALVAVLTADPATAEMAGGHVYGVELPKAAVEAMPLNALVVQPSGGTPLTAESDAALETQRVDILAYAATPALANELRRRAIAALKKVKRKTFAGVLIHWVNSAGGFSSAREREGLWPQSFQSLQTLYSTQEV